MRSPAAAYFGPPYNWTGFYAGGNMGIGWGKSNWNAGPGISGSTSLFQTIDTFDEAGSFFAGVQGGYNYVLPNRILLGAESTLLFEYDGHIGLVAFVLAVRNHVAPPPLSSHQPWYAVVAPRVVFVLADKVQIRQVLLNLMRNAIEAMEDSERRELVVSTALTADDMVEISVADTGAGISPEIPAHVRSSWPATKFAVVRAYGREGQARAFKTRASLIVAARSPRV